jgi:hypothetical protein
MKCIFCGGGNVAGNRISEEHIWSDWMHKAKLLPASSTGNYFESTKSTNLLSGKKSHFKRKRQGSIQGKKLKIVCENCNRG